MKRASYHHGDLRRALLRAARDSIARSGPEAFTLREIARACGVDHTAAYRHFEDKRALLAALAEEAFTGLGAAVDREIARMAPAGAGERLVRIGAAYVRFALANPSRYRLMFGPRLNEDGRFPALEAAISGLLRSTVAEVEKGMAAGELRAGDAQDAALGLWSMAHGYVDAVLRRRIRIRSRALAVRHFERLLGTFVDGLRESAHERAPAAGRRRTR